MEWGKPEGAPKSKKPGLPLVGAFAYAMHPSTVVRWLAYDLKDGRPARQWREGDPPPVELFQYIQSGGLIEAHNASFERVIWEQVCHKRMGWPPVHPGQWRCSKAKASAYALPPALASVAKVLQLPGKDARGDALIKRLSIPQKMTPARTSEYFRLMCIGLPPDLAAARACMDADGQAMAAFGQYNLRDIEVEEDVSIRIPDLCPHELPLWQLDQTINSRGVAIDVAALHACADILKQVFELYDGELQRLTFGMVDRASETKKLTEFIARFGVHLDNMQEETVTAVLKNPALPYPVRRALEIRELVGLASVKKVFAMLHNACPDGRIRGLYNYYGARTGRPTGEGPQPTNLPNSGPDMYLCVCGEAFRVGLVSCPYCGLPRPPKPQEWGPEATESVIRLLLTRDLARIEHVVGSALAAISACLRGFFIAPPGRDLIVSDYNSIEAIVLAMLAGEQWRIDVFRTHGKIYEMSAAKISGVSFNDFMKHAGYTDEELSAPDWYKRKPAKPGSHHPLRKSIGKVAELASGFQGGSGSWVQFGADEFLTPEQIADGVKAWRAASPAIVEFWGGQRKKINGFWEPCLYGVEGSFIAAVQNPGASYTFRGLKFQYDRQTDVLTLTLLSGRDLHYHRPRLSPHSKFQGSQEITYEGNNTNPKNGPVGWIRMYTYGGRLTENIVQATARDIQQHGLRLLEAAGYNIVLHVYDEDVAEVPEGFGSVAEFEKIMMTLPDWAADWPIRASGGWRRKRYGK